MFTSLLAALAVIIAVQALRQSSQDQIVIHVMPESISTQRGPALPPFVHQAGVHQAGGQQQPLAGSYPVTVGKARQPEPALELFPIRRELPISAAQLEPPLVTQPPLPILQRALQPVPMEVHRN